MKKRMSRIIAIMLVLLMVVCNQSYSSMASDTDNSISGEAKTLSGENEAGYTEVATDSDAGIEVNNAVIAEEDKNTDTEEDTEANDNSDEEINSDMKDVADESEVSEEGEDEKTYPLFVRSCSVDGIRVTVTASEGAFPEGATLSVNKVTDSEKEQINQAVEAVRDDSVSVAEAYTFDIKVLDENGTELQPANGQTVNVSFAMDEVSNQNLSTDIYHIPEENGSLVAEELSTSESGNTVTAVSDGFSYYTVEFTYNEKQYVMEGDSSVALTDILSYVGITRADGNAATDSDITAVSVSDESLFSASNDSGEWMVTAHQAFTSNEWMKVTVDGVEYSIVVTDDAATYQVTVNVTNLTNNHSPWGSSGHYPVWVEATTDKGGSGNNGNKKSTTAQYNYSITFTYTGEEPTNVNFKVRYNSAGYNPNDLIAQSNYTAFTGSGNFGTSKTTTVSYSNGTNYQETITYTASYQQLISDPTYNISGTTDTYDGMSKKLVTANGAGGTIHYRYKLDTALDYSEWQTDIPSATESGTYIIQWYSEGNSTYNAMGSSSSPAGTVNATINKANISPSVTMNGWIYGDTENEPSTSGYNGNGAVTYKYKISTADDSTYTETKPSDAGTYTVKAEVASTTNYNGGTATTDFTISQKEVNLIWGDTSFTYNGSQQVPTATISGVINGDDCTVSVNGAKTDYSASPYTATAVLSGAKKGNYKLPAENTKQFTISKKAATITANDQTVTYGTSIASGVDNAIASDLVDGDTLTAITLTPSTSDVTTYGTITPSAVVIKKGDTDVTNNYNITYNTGSLTINKKPITISGITASNKTYDGTTVATLNYSGINWADCGKVGDDDLSVTATGAFSDAGIGTEKTVTISDLALSGAKAGNYELAESGQQTSTTADITAKALTIKADSDSKVYDGTAHTKNSYSVTSGVLADGDTIESVTVTGSQKYAGSSANVPSDAVIKNSSGVDVTPNYNITYTNGTVEVTKKPLTITADSDTKVYDTTPLTKNSYTNTALAAGETIESVTVTGSQTSVGESANVPSAAVIKNGDDDVTANYDITYVNGTLKVTKKVVTITANSDTKTYDGTALTNDGYTVSGLEAGDRVDRVTITGTQTKAGTSNNVPSAAVIKNSADEVVNDNYTISYVNGTLEVTPKAVTITADSDTKVYDGTALTKDSYTNSELAAGDTIENVTVTGSQISAGEGANVPSAAVIKNANGEAVTASYDITYINGTLEVTPKAITITADDAAKVYDGTALTKDSYTNSDLAAGDSIESVTITGSQTDAGESANVPSAAVIKNASNEDVTACYDITYKNGTLEVSKKPVTISGITIKDKIYDGTTDAELDYSDIDWSACGMVDGDELSVTAKGTYEDTSVGEDKSVTITDITIGGTSVDNYILADDGHQTRTTAKIMKKSVTVTALKQTVAVNGEIENSVDMAELTGAVEGHKLAEITLTSGSTEKTTTEGVITPSEVKIVDGDIDVTDNYDITYIDGVMTVTKAEAEVVLDNGDDEAPASVTAVEVPNLLELADEEAEEGKLVKVELSVKPVSESNVNSATVADVKKTVESLFAFVDMESVKVEYLEIDLTKYVDNVKDSAISDTGTPLEIILTYDTSKAGNPVIIRKHEGTVKVFTQLSSRASGSLTDATYYVEGDKIYMYSQYFSDFAIAYSVEKTFNVNLDDGNGNIIRQIVSEGAKFIPPADLTKDGHDFDGWYKDETFTEKWNPDTDKVTSDIMLYAKWAKKVEPTKADTPETKVDTPKAATTPTNTAKSPATGDAMHKYIAFFLMIFAALGMICLRFIRKKDLR